MAAVYGKQAIRALQQIAAKGKLVTWRVLQNGAPADPSKPWQPSAATFQDHFVSIVFFPIGLVGSKTLRYRESNEVATGSIIGFMGAVDFEPKIKDVVLYDGQELVVKAIDTLAPNGEIVLHEIEFEK